MKKIVITIVFIITIVACNQNKEIINNVIYPIEHTININNFDSIIDEIIILPLETSENCLIYSPQKTIVFDTLLIIGAQNRIAIFNSKTGNFIRRIGKLGKGPGEFVKITDFCLNLEKNQIWLVDISKRVLKFSIIDGRLIEEITPRFKTKMRTIDGIAPSNYNGFFLFCSNPYKVDNYDDEFYCLYEFNNIGKIISTQLKRIDFCFNPGRITYSKNGEYIIRPLEGDKTIYKIIDGKLNKYLDIDFQKHSIPGKYITQFNGGAFANIRKYMRSPYFKLPSNIYETDSYIYFKAVGPEKVHEFLFKKDNFKKGIRWLEDQDNMLQFAGSDTEYFYCILPQNFSNNNSNTNNALLKEVLKRIDISFYKPESNPIFVKIKFKI